MKPLPYRFLLIGAAFFICILLCSYQIHGANRSALEGIRSEASAAPLNVLTFTLIDAQTNLDIGPLLHGDVINLATTSGQINIRANTSPAIIGSVKFSLDANGNYARESLSPYALAGDDGNGDYNDWVPSLGVHTLTATPYSGINATGTAGVSVTISFTVIDNSSIDCNGVSNGTAFIDNCGICAGGTTGLVPNANKDNCGVCFGNGLSCINNCTTPTGVALLLVHEGTAGIIDTLTDGYVIDKSLVGNFSVQAKTCPDTVGSVVFKVNGSTFRTESGAPYAINGDSPPGNFTSWNPNHGVYTLIATPYTGANGGGTAGIPDTVHISVLDSVTGPALPSSDCGKFPGGRIVLTHDGNQHDSDDYPALPMAMAILDAAGLNDKVVHIEHSNHIGNNNPAQEQQMITSAMGGAQRFGFPTSIIYDVQQNPDTASDAMAAAINASSSGDPIWILAAGPMESTWRGINKALPSKRKYVRVVSHSIPNNNHTDTPDLIHDWDDLKTDFQGDGTLFYMIQDQNHSNGAFDFKGLKGSWQWLLTSGNPDWQWLYYRNVTTAFDVSDAGLTYWLISGGPVGGNEQGGWAEVKDLMENPCDTSRQVNLVVSATTVQFGAANKVTISTTVTNSNSDSIGKAISIGYYASLDSVIGPLDILLGEDTLNGLAAGQGITFSKSFHLCSTNGIVSGTHYYFGAVADNHQDISETMESDNEEPAAGIHLVSCAPPFVNFIVENVTANVLPNNLLVVYANVKNVGNDTAHHVSRLNYYASVDSVITNSDIYLGPDGVGYLKPGEVSSESAVIDLCANSEILPGTAYFIGAIADSDSQVPESDETDNGGMAPAAVSNSCPPPPFINLVVSQISAQLGTNSQLTIEAEVKNDGTDTIHSLSQLTYYASLDSIIDTNDIFLRIDSLNGLLPGEISLQNAVLELCQLPDLQNGMPYYFGLIANLDSSEQMESNVNDNSLHAKNSLFYTCYVPPFVNLIVENVTATMYPNNVLVVGADVKNIGNDTLKNVSRLNYYASLDADITSSDIYLGPDGVGYLKPGESGPENMVVYLCNYPQLVPGVPYYFGAIADSDSRIDESDENDNAGVAPGTVTSSCPLPSSINFTLSNTTAQLNGSNLLKLNTKISNSGAGATSTPSSVGLYASVDNILSTSDYLLGEILVNSLGAGASKSLSLTVNICNTTGLPNGSYYIGALADYKSEVLETNENDNGNLASGTVTRNCPSFSMAANRTANPGMADLSRIEIEQKGEGEPEVNIVTEHGNASIDPVKYVRKDLILNVYPNPVGSKGKLVVEAIGIGRESWKVKIYSVQGRLLRQARVVWPATKTEIDMKNLPAGSYYVRAGNAVWQQSEVVILQP